MKCVAGRTYTILLSSDDFDAYLRLEDPSGKTIAEDDDSGGGKNGHDAQIVFKADKTATYSIAATALHKSKGKYTLTVVHDGVGTDKEITYLLDVKAKLTKDDPKDKGRGSTCYSKTYPFDMRPKRPTSFSSPAVTSMPTSAWSIPTARKSPATTTAPWKD